MRRARDDGLDAALNGRVIADIHLDQLDTGYGPCFGRIAHGAKHLATLLGKLFRGGTSDARRHTGHHDNFRIRHNNSFSNG
jgi:hypothetical protein